MVIDASVGVKLIIPEADSSIAINLVESMQPSVPGLFHVEVGNAIWKKLRRGEIELGPLMPYLRSLTTLVQTFDETVHVPRAIDIAAELDHPIYDCLYVAIAEAMSSLVITADQQFLRKTAGTAFANSVRPLERWDA